MVQVSTNRLSLRISVLGVLIPVVIAEAVVMRRVLSVLSLIVLMMRLAYSAWDVATWATVGLLGWVVVW